MKVSWPEQERKRFINMNLWKYFLENDGNKITRWTHYFPIYEKHFERFRNKPVKILEIGVLNGGSLPMWQKYFGPLSKIVAIDITPSCKSYEIPGTQVRIGDQSDEKFLQELVDEFGEFDVVIDDGSHQVAHVNKTFQYLYPKMSKNGVYLVEDTHAAYWKDSHGGGLDEPESIINVSKNLIDKLNADHTRGQVEPDDFTRSTQSITFYDSVIVFERGEIHWKQPLEFGKNTPMDYAPNPELQQAARNSAPDVGDFTIRT